MESASDDKRATADPPAPTLAAELKAPTITRAYQCQCVRHARHWLLRRNTGRPHWHW